MLLAEPGDVDAAVQAAAKAFEDWRDVVGAAPGPGDVRDARAHRQAHRRARAASSPTSTARRSTTRKGEVTRGLEVVEFACGHPARCSRASSPSRCRPTSTPTPSASRSESCAGITPFNFPVMVPMWMHPVAIATGNAFVLKPSERDPSASNFVAELYADAGLPDGVFNVVHGDKVAVDAILDHPDIAAVSFVGSTPIARYIYERGTRSGKRVQALGGAKNHAVVLPDADLDFTADHLVAAGYGSAGQRCMAISAVVAVGAAGDALVDKLRGSARSASWSARAATPASEMGPVVTAEARDRIAGYIDSGEAAARRVVVDGRGLVVDGHEDGFFVGPTLLDHVTPTWPSTRDEIFGPVLVVLRADTLDEAIELINANPYGNGTAIFTSSGEAARDVPAQGQRRDDRHQRPDPGADGLLLVRRLEGLAVRRPPHPRPRRGEVLHPGQGRDEPVAACPRRHRRSAQLPDGSLIGSTAVGAARRQARPDGLLRRETCFHRE